MLLSLELTCYPVFRNNGLPQLSRLGNDRIVRGQFCLPYGNLVRSRDKTGFPRFT